VALVQLEADLRHAITRNEFEIYYQPIVSLHTGTVIGVEALLRWHHPTRGCLAPEAFLGAAEDTGLIMPIGEWVLHAACQQTQAWHAAALPPVYVTVNLSARHLKQRDLGTMIAQILHDTRLPPHYLHIELTESSVMEDVTLSIATLQQLTALGVQVAVDDFGTGYSSLSYLKRLPLTTVKVDRTFVDHITSDPNDAAIAAAMVAMAHRLGLQVIAVGVETVAQVRHLQREQCDAIQGYVVSRPIAAAALTARLVDGNWLPPLTVQRGG
jgi:EAL domain-containing protein (putative c-di-GMP-specific phosphodiesterase class I)